MRLDQILSGNSVIVFLLIIFLIPTGCERITDVPADVELLEGEWNVDEQSQNFKAANASYRVYISISPQDSSRLQIFNFYHLGNDTEVLAKTDGNRLELLSNQSVSTSGVTYTIVSGTGIITDDYRNIDWEYKVDDGSGEIDNATAVYTKL